MSGWTGASTSIAPWKDARIDVLRRDGRVGFSTAVDVCIIREKSTTHFRSLCGTGRVSEVTDTEEKRRALDAISLRFDARCPRPTPDAALARVNILRIDVESLTCRHKNGRAARTRNRKKGLCFLAQIGEKALSCAGKVLTLRL